MQAIEALLRRHSGRALGEPAPDDGALGLMFESATRAPDHGRLRPWRFIVIRGEQRAAFGELLAAHLRRSRDSVSEESVERERRKAFRAPVILVVAAVVSTNAKVPEIEQILSAGAAAQNILLAAFALGFSAVWKTGGAAYDEQVKRSLGLEPKDHIAAFIYVGTERDERPALARPAWKDFVHTWAGATEPAVSPVEASARLG